MPIISRDQARGADLRIEQFELLQCLLVLVARVKVNPVEVVIRKRSERKQTILHMESADVAGRVPADDAARILVGVARS
jgi:hypothetical protein